MNLLEKLGHARRVSAPLVAISTADQPNLIKRCSVALNGNGTPILSWDYLSGIRPLNEAGKKVAAAIGQGDQDATVQNPAGLLLRLIELPEQSVVFACNWDQFLREQDAPAILQGMSNLRDQFKTDRRMLIVLSPSKLNLPAALRNDVVSLEDPLPDEQALRAIADLCDESVLSIRPAMDEETKNKAVEAVKGINSFAAETAILMALRKQAPGIDLDHLQDQKRAKVGQIPGLSVDSNDLTFDDMGGLDQVKELGRVRCAVGRHQRADEGIDIALLIAHRSERRTLAQVQAEEAAFR